MHRLMRLQQVQQGASLSVNQLARLLDVTPRTVYRDLKLLRELGSCVLGGEGRAAVAEAIDALGPLRPELAERLSRLL